MFWLLWTSLGDTGLFVFFVKLTPLKFLSIFMPIFNSIEPVTLICVSLERSYLRKDDADIKADDVISETKANTRHGRLRSAQESVG